MAYSKQAEEINKTTIKRQTNPKNKSQAEEQHLPKSRRLNSHVPLE